ncbi:MAG: hypothetical protein P8103_06400 [Candidatus Thiodiazotropha sp.]
MKGHSLCLVVALPAEAKPVIRALGLKRLQPDGAYPRYGRGAITLVLSGPGQLAAGKAVAWIASMSANSATYWINLGIAGHARLQPGEVVCADRVIDTSTGEAWALEPLSGLPATRIGPLRCVVEAETRFADVAAYDMESSAIARVLAGDSALSRLQVLKIISDNPANPSRGINAKMVAKLIEGALPTLETMIHCLLPHAETR